ncbi:MAG: glycine cleavage system protein H [Anaerolineales bacterium]
MTVIIEFTIDKFTFRIATDRSYNDEGVWAKLEDGQIRIGISDYLQQRSGDVAFTEVKPEGNVVKQGEEIAVIETIKVNISIGSPVTGTVIEVNPAMKSSPEVINQDPYESGWLAMLEAKDWENDARYLLNAHTYFAKIKGEVEQEVKPE